MTSCVIPEAPEYGAPRQTPIFIIDNDTSPDPRSLIQLRNVEQGSFPFTVRVRSEDAGEGLFAALLSDYKHEGARSDYQRIPVPPSTLDDESRFITLSLRLPDKNLGDGCHTFTLMVTHESEWDYLKNQPLGTPSDLASVTWFSAVSSLSPPAVLVDCPNPANQATTTPTP